MILLALAGLSPVAIIAPQREEQPGWRVTSTWLADLTANQQFIALMLIRAQLNHEIARCLNAPVAKTIAGMRWAIAIQMHGNAMLSELATKSIVFRYATRKVANDLGIFLSGQGLETDYLDSMKITQAMLLGEEGKINMGDGLAITRTHQRQIEQSATSIIIQAKSVADGGGIMSVTPSANADATLGHARCG
jgi:hypothetical protein